MMEPRSTGRVAMPDDLYERDILVWSEKQAALLRRLARGEGLNEAVDWDHVIEEVEDVGLSELRACRNLLRQALVHLIKLHEEQGYPADHWRLEGAAFLADVQSKITPSMRRQIDVADAYRRAQKQIRSGRPKSSPRLMVPDDCPYTLDELLDENAEVDALVAKLG